MWLPLLSNQKIIAGFRAKATSKSRNLPIPSFRNMTICWVNSGGLSTLEFPVAKSWCQKRAIFSSSGLRVLIIRYTHSAWLVTGARAPS